MVIYYSNGSNPEPQSYAPEIQFGDKLNHFSYFQIVYVCESETVFPVILNFV